MLAVGGEEERHLAPLVAGRVALQPLRRVEFAMDLQALVDQGLDRRGPALGMRGNGHGKRDRQGECRQRGSKQR
ncbi:hypothetical protein [Halomonas sp. E19]|uniref:hypothetical protein n=1 Tax=Halomonas sp. E19 TaxID=3397247 RepID=UPI004033E840